MDTALLRRRSPPADATCMRIMPPGIIAPALQQGFATLQPSGKLVLPGQQPAGGKVLLRTVGPGAGGLARARPSVAAFSQLSCSAGGRAPQPQAPAQLPVAAAAAQAAHVALPVRCASVNASSATLTASPPTPVTLPTSGSPRRQTSHTYSYQPAPVEAVTSVVRSVSLQPIPTSTPLSPPCSGSTRGGGSGSASIPDSSRGSSAGAPAERRPTLGRRCGGSVSRSTLRESEASPARYVNSGGTGGTPSIAVGDLSPTGGCVLSPCLLSPFDKTPRCRAECANDESPPAKDAVANGRDKENQPERKRLPACLWLADQPRPCTGGCSVTTVAADACLGGRGSPLGSRISPLGSVLSFTLSEDSEVDASPCNSRGRGCSGSPRRGGRKDSEADTSPSHGRGGGTSGSPRRSSRSPKARTSCFPLPRMQRMLPLARRAASPLPGEARHSCPSSPAVGARVVGALCFDWSTVVAAADSAEAEAEAEEEMDIMPCEDLLPSRSELLWH